MSSLDEILNCRKIVLFFPSDRVALPYKRAFRAVPNSEILFRVNPKHFHPCLIIVKSFLMGLSSIDKWAVF